MVLFRGTGAFSSQALGTLRPLDRILRTVAYTLVYFSFASIVFQLFGAANAPARGSFTSIVNGILLGFSVLSMLFLLFLVVDATRLCICWIDQLRSPNLDWTGSGLDKVARRLRLPPDHAKYWMLIHLIGERTRAVGRLLYYLVIIILLMLLARSTYFDDWGFPQALAIIVGANFLIAVVTAARLNATARTAREEILGQLQSENLELQNEETSKPPIATPSELKELIAQLSQLQIGAFQRIWDQPILRASFLFLGGVGITYAEYLPFLS